MPETTVTDVQSADRRQCGRCRAYFPGDPTLHPTALPAWWLCPSCHEALIGPRA